MARSAQILLLILMSFAGTLGHAANSAPEDWTRLARQVGLNEHSHATAMSRLRKIKNLDSVLLKALETPQRALALDVVVALKMENLIPDLLERASSDDDGFLILALNSFLTPDHQDQILKFYSDNLSSDRERLLSAAAIVAMLDPLGRAGRALPLPALTQLLQHEFPEVRSATLSYVRHLTSQGGHREEFEIVRRALSSSPYQLRIQAYFLVQELEAKPETKPWVDFTEIASLCDKEQNTSVKPWCEKLVAKHMEPKE